MTEWIAPAAGVLLLLMLAVDVFQTVFHAEGRGGPVNRRQNRIIWHTVRRIATRGGRTREKVLAFAGPAMSVATIAVWSLLLLCGFALVYLPYIAGFHFSTGTPGSAPLEAFYYSGILASTVGQGDVVAPGGWLRAITVIQALGGFASVTVAVTYVLAVYRELILAQTLASLIDARLAASPVDADESDALDRSLAIRLTHVIESHHNYPILHYFRPVRNERSVPVQVARLFRARRERAAARDETMASRVLDGVVHRYIREVHTLFVPDQRGEGVGNGSERDRLRDILSMMAYDRTLAG